MTDAAIDGSDGSGGRADASTNDGGAETSSIGDSGGGEMSVRDAAGSVDAEGGLSEAGDGAPTLTACEVVLNLVHHDSWIAFDSDRDNFNRNLYMMHPDRTGLTQLTTGANNDRQPSFSYDGKRLSYTSTVAGKPQIFIMDLATRTPVQLTKRAEGADESSFSRDGQWVAFHSGAAVYVIRADGTGERLVATGPDIYNAFQWPVFSTDGTELIFHDNLELDVIKLDGSAPLRLVSRGSLKMPALSPSGVDVALATRCDPSPMLSIWTQPAFATDQDSCRGRRVTPLDAYDAERPTWANGLVLAYRRFDRNISTNDTGPPEGGMGVIAMISRLDGRPCFLTTGPDDSRNPSWSP